MRVSERSVLPEVLDGLGAEDPRGLRSRRDLQRVHLAMRTVAILKRTMTALRFRIQPRRVIELGAGDGTLLLRLARALSPGWTDVELTLLDRIDLVSAQTRAAYRELGWRVTVLPADALAWAAGAAAAAGATTRTYDLCIANLFLHHFETRPLTGLLRGVAAAADAFVACEPRRGTWARLGSRLVWFLGANDITREDAVTSVAAGFTGEELSAIWPAASPEWSVQEFMAPPFSHCFAAIRARARAAGGDHGL